MQGQAPSADPDQAAGVAIRVEGGHNVRILHAHVRGYKVGILARGTRNLTLARDDFGHNWKPRLFSVIEHESLVDWLSFHHNEHDEWLRYGAAVYLADVTGCRITTTRNASGCVSVRAPTSRTSAAARSTTCASSRAWKA